MSDSERAPYARRGMTINRQTENFLAAVDDHMYRMMNPPFNVEILYHEQGNAIDVWMVSEAGENISSTVAMMGLQDKIKRNHIRPRMGECFSMHLLNDIMHGVYEEVYHYFNFAGSVKVYSMVRESHDGYTPQMAKDKLVLSIEKPGAKKRG